MFCAVSAALRLPTCCTVPLLQIRTIKGEDIFAGWLVTSQWTVCAAFLFADLVFAAYYAVGPM